MRARICSAFSCDMFARVVWLRLRRAIKPPTFTLLLCRTHSPRMARATNSCTPRELTNARSALVGVAETGQGSEGGRRKSSLLTFAALFVSEKRDKRKVASWFFRNIKSINHLNFHSRYGKYLTQLCWQCKKVMIYLWHNTQSSEEMWKQQKPSSYIQPCLPLFRHLPFSAVRFFAWRDLPAPVADWHAHISMLFMGISPRRSVIILSFSLFLSMYLFLRIEIALLCADFAVPPTYFSRYIRLFS